MTENDLHTQNLLDFFSAPQPKKKTSPRLSRHFWIFLSGYLLINLVASQYQNYQSETQHTKVVKYLELVALKESANRAVNTYATQMELDNEKIKSLTNLKYTDKNTQSQIDQLKENFKLNQYNLRKSVKVFNNIQHELNTFSSNND